MSTPTPEEFQASQNMLALYVQLAAAKSPDGVSEDMHLLLTTLGLALADLTMSQLLIRQQDPTFDPGNPVSLAKLPEPVRASQQALSNVIHRLRAAITARTEELKTVRELYGDMVMALVE